MLAIAVARILWTDFWNDKPNFPVEIKQVVTATNIPSLSNLSFKTGIANHRDERPTCTAKFKAYRIFSLSIEKGLDQCTPAKNTDAKSLSQLEKE
mmetsp:Transcript_8614/g.21580  ORF Transcript_8614/g.21580 Transcript_8614/m.21580 type:complete len:95 (+) Transcript_8614:1242-1526(+)